jgi:hypothetical protein
LPLARTKLGQHKATTPQQDALQSEESSLKGLLAELHMLLLSYSLMCH